MSVPASQGPYKGPESYQVEDADFFFGRDQEAFQLVSTILSARMTVLHAPSGAGKTSLLNARIIPHLEARGWTPVRILPHNDPIESTRVTTLQYVVPAPETEVAAFDRAVAALAPDEPDLRLDDLLARYDGLEVTDPLNRALISPVESPRLETAGVLPTAGAVTPYFCRLLRKSIELPAFTEHLAAVARGAGKDLEITGETPLSRLRAVLADPALAATHRELLSRLYTPVPGLRLFFENLCETYGDHLADFALVLVFDQFEELFTRFVDPGPTARESAAELPNWRLRPRFFEELESLYLPGASSEPGLSAGLLPIRFVVSLRDEYIARLEPLRLFAPEVDNSSYHLSFLEVGAARSAIQSPARQYGFSYSSACLEAILRQLTREDRFIEPSHLQIVCEKIWSRHLAEQQTADSGRPGSEVREIPLETLEGLHGVQGILGSFLSEFLKELSPDDRLETLELLEPLITSSGTRNIVESTTLIHSPFRDPRQRNRLMHRLVRRRLVRTEWRLGGYFVEITHEFLIKPILEQVRLETMSNPDYWRLRGALRSLLRFQDTDFRGPAMQLLPMDDFSILDKNRDRIRWTPWASELMLRSALWHQADKETLREWARRHEAYGELPKAGELLAGRVLHDTRALLLSREELLQVDAQRESLPVEKEQLERILRSALWLAEPGDRELVRHWTKRLEEGQAP